METSTFSIRRPGNRMLAFTEYGDRRGKPVFYFHGWPASRLSGGVYDVIARKLHIRIISPDRPGYGLSDYRENRMLTEWPDDVVAIADYLKIAKFAVMGVSGGGPYAAVCAAKIPKRLTKAGIVVGLGPVIDAHSFDGLLPLSKLGWRSFRMFPPARTIAAVTQWLLVRSGLFKIWNHYAWGPEDRKLLRRSGLGKRNEETQTEAFRQGFRGPERDLVVYSADWGFSPADSTVPVYLWYGGSDRNVSLNMGTYYKTMIPGSVLKIYPGEGHLISVTHAEEILKTLTCEKQQYAL